MTSPERLESSSRTSSVLFDFATAPARWLSRYRSDLAASLADDGAAFAGPARMLFALLAVIAVGYPLVASVVHASVHSIPRIDPDQIILSPFFEDYYVEAPLFMLAAVAVGLFSPALGALFVLVLAPADLIAAQAAPITELVPAQGFDLILIPIAGRLVGYALLWILAVEIPLQVRRYASVWASRRAVQPSVAMAAGASVLSAMVLVFLWTRAIPYLFQTVGRTTQDYYLNYLGNTAMRDFWWVVVIGAAVAAAIAAIWPRPARRDEEQAVTLPATPRSPGRQLGREIAGALAFAVLLSGLMTEIWTALLITGSLLLAGPVLNRVLPRLRVPNIGSSPRSPARWLIALATVLALSWVALAMAPSDITDGYLIAAVIVAVVVPLFRILLEAGTPATEAPRASRELPPPVLTTVLALAVVGLWLALPAVALAHDCFTNDELPECMRQGADSLLAMAAAAAAAGASALFSPDIWEQMKRQYRERHFQPTEADYKRKRHYRRSQK